MGCCSGIVRTIMFVFNFACLAVGVVLIAVGTLFYVSIDTYDDLIENTSGLNIVPSVSIAFGVIVFLIAFLGCCGALKNSSCMLMTYAIVLIIMLVAQLAIGIYGLVHINNSGKEIQDEVITGMKNAFEKYDNDKVIRDLFQSMQSDLECCGVDGSYDYALILNWPVQKYAGGCCGKPTADFCELTDPINHKGCGKELFSVIKDAVKIVAIVALVICAVELLGAIVAICLVKSK